MPAGPSEIAPDLATRIGIGTSLPAHGPRGLRRQWRRVLAALIATLSIAMCGTMVSYLEVVQRYNTAGRELDRAVELSSLLSDSIAGHEALSHALWNGKQIDRALYLRQQNEIVATFDKARTELHHSDQHRLVVRAQTVWEQVLKSRGLWGPTAGPGVHVTTAMQQQFGSDADAVAGALNQLTRVATVDGSRAIGGADAFKSLVFGFLIALFVLVLGVAIFFARRMTRDVLQPIETLQRAATRLAAGHLQQRVSIRPRRHANELSALATTFNAMADAVDTSHRELSYQASHDSLTGLPNRAAFEADLEHRMTTDDQRRLDGLGVLFIDLDDFKLVNDSLGHASGDALLQQVAGRLERCVRPSDLVARLGGDEFAIVVVDAEQGAKPPIDVANRALNALSQPFALSETSVSVGASIGISVRRPEMSAGELLAQADFAMYVAKSAGKHRFSLFEPAQQTRSKTTNAISAAEAPL